MTPTPCLHHLLHESRSTVSPLSQQHPILAPKHDLYLSFLEIEQSASSKPSSSLSSSPPTLIGGEVASYPGTKQTLLLAPYREYLAKKVDIDYTHKKQSGGSGQFGRVKFTVTPGERGSGIIFTDAVKGGNIPKEYIPSVEKGMRETAETGSLIGFPIIDFEIELYDGAYHDVDSSALAFEICARAAMREAAQKAGIKLLEPIMKVEVVTPEDYLGDVIGDMNSRRGQIQGTDSRGNAQVVEAMVPLANMFGYVNQLRSFTQGRAQYTMQFSHYDEVPANVAEEVKAKLA